MFGKGSFSGFTSFSEELHVAAPGYFGKGMGELNVALAFCWL